MDNFYGCFVPTIFITDSEIQPEGRCISEKLEKIGGKRRPQPKKFVYKGYSCEIRDMIAIIDYGMGNLRSVLKAFEAVGAQAKVTHVPGDILKADKVVLPGVGAMGPAMQKLQELALTGPIRKVVQDGKPFLGICLGMQLLFEKSSEGGFSEGLRILKGSVERFTDLKVPHMGWNQVQDSACRHKIVPGSFIR